MSPSIRRFVRPRVVVAGLLLPAATLVAREATAGRLAATPGASHAPTPDAEPLAPQRADSIWVVTNRAHADGAWAARPDTLTTALRTFRVTPLRTDPVPYEVRLDVARLAESTLPRAEMFDALRAATERSGRPLVLHVHGYATGFDEATEEAAEMRHRAGYDGPVAVFAWPARSVGVTWPAPGRWLTNAYWQDAEMAAASADELADVLHDLVRTLGADQVVLSAHSMGNQLVAATLARPDVVSLLSASPLRAVAFVSPDLDRADFRERVLPVARPLAQRLVLYGARNDHMLRIAAIVHDGPRAGFFDARGDWPDELTDVERVDITNGHVAAPWLGAWTDTNHALRRHGTALADLFGVVASGAAAPAESRCALPSGAFSDAASPACSDLRE